MPNHNYVPLLCHTCGTIINARANGDRLIYYHNEHRVKRKEETFTCPNCNQEELSFIEYLTDEEVLSIAENDIFEKVLSILKRPDLKGKRILTITL